jgi:hypothetical protein
LSLCWFGWCEETLAIFSPRTTARVERNRFVSRDGSTASKLRGEHICLLMLQWHDDPGVFATPAMDDSDRCSEREERNYRGPRELWWGKIAGHQ